jgi:hypothetical protein
MTHSHSASGNEDEVKVNGGFCVSCDAAHAIHRHPYDGQPVCEECYRKALVRMAGTEN